MDLNNTATEISKFSHFLSLSFEDSRYPSHNEWISDTLKIDSRVLIIKLRDICVKNSNIIETLNITISSTHIKETYKILNSHIFTILEEVNVDFISVFGDDVFTDMMKSYFLFYKKFNDIKIEYVSSNENYMLIYDHKPLCLIVDKITEFEYANDFYTPPTHIQGISVSKQLMVEYKYQKELHNAIRFNFSNNPLKVERKLKIEELSKNS